MQSKEALEKRDAIINNFMYAQLTIVRNDVVKIIGELSIILNNLHNIDEVISVLKTNKYQ
jgi:hypothetical protein